MYPPHTFSGNPLNREDVNRRDATWLEAMEHHEDTRFLIMPGMQVPMTSGNDGRIAWFLRTALDSVLLNREDPPIFLGTENGVAHFAMEVATTAAEQLPMKGIRLEESRAAGMALNAQEAGIVAQARSQIEWHRRSRYCGACGGQTRLERGGHSRSCAKCGNQNFPRTDPVVIMVVVQGDSCLLGQSHGRLSQTNTFSALAGFVDQGESIEEAVRREVREEAGITVGDVRYHSSQPWPFPYSLMIGCHAHALSSDIVIDSSEMADVRWFDRSGILESLTGDGKIRLPGPIAIAHHLIRSWAKDELELFH